jgi:hypothetical protein
MKNIRLDERRKAFSRLAKQRICHKKLHEKPCHKLIDENNQLTRCLPLTWKFFPDNSQIMPHFFASSLSQDKGVRLIHYTTHPSTAERKQHWVMSLAPSSLPIEMFQPGEKTTFRS